MAVRITSLRSRHGSRLRPGELSTGTERCELEDGRALALETEGEPLNIGRKTRSISPALQRALKARDGGCRFPGCGRSRYTEGHHVVHWVEREKFVFTRPDGTRITTNGAERFRGNNSSQNGTPREGAPHERVHAARPALHQLNREAGVAIDWQTSRCKWTGERMDYGLAIEALIQRRDMASGSGASR